MNLLTRSEAYFLQFSVAILMCVILEGVENRGYYVKKCAYQLKFPCKQAPFHLKAVHRWSNFGSFGLPFDLYRQSSLGQAAGMGCVLKPTPVNSLTNRFKLSAIAVKKA